MHKSKNRYFLPHFWFPWGRPGAITLNVVWIERELDAYKLSGCMCPCNYNRFWDTARMRDICEKKSSFYHTPLHSTPPLGGIPFEYRYPVWYGKTRMVWLPLVKKFRFDATQERDRQTDRHTDTAWRHIPRLCIALRGKNGAVDIVSK